MQCPDCGFVMGDFDKECARCQKYGKPQPRLLPVQVKEIPAPAQQKPQQSVRMTRAQASAIKKAEQNYQKAKWELQVTGFVAFVILCLLLVPHHNDTDPQTDPVPIEQPSYAPPPQPHVNVMAAPSVLKQIQTQSAPKAHLDDYTPSYSGSDSYSTHPDTPMSERTQSVSGYWHHDKNGGMSWTNHYMRSPGGFGRRGRR